MVKYQAIPVCPSIISSLKKKNLDGGASVQEMMEYEVDMCVCVCALKGFHDKTHREVDFFFSVIFDVARKNKHFRPSGFSQISCLRFCFRNRKNS